MVFGIRPWHTRTYDSRTAAHMPENSRPTRSSSRPGAYPESVVRLIDRLAELPGIGRRSAERLAFHVLKTPSAEIVPLAEAIRDVKERVRHCRVCYNLCDSASTPASAVSGGRADQALCAICADDSRDRATVMVVEQPKDLIALEQTGAFKGIYHVLMGRISPLENVGPGDVTLSDLVERVEHPERNAGGVPIAEVVLAMNPNLEGDGTSLYLAEALANAKSAGSAGRGTVRVTRLARGVPTGSQLEYASKAVLADAIEGRKAV